MSTRNICLPGEIRKYLPDTHSYLDIRLNLIFCILQYLSNNGLSKEIINFLTLARTPKLWIFVRSASLIL